ncbi:MAG: hypothetical protein ACTSXO_08570 [Candidatus Heimdallarchaeota archaeon]
MIGTFIKSRVVATLVVILTFLMVCTNSMNLEVAKNVTQKSATQSASLQIKPFTIKSSQNANNWSFIGKIA